MTTDLLTATLAELLAEVLPRESLLEAEARGEEPAGYRERLEEIGFFSLLVPEEDGGLGLDAATAADVFEVTGRRLLPVSALEEVIGLAPPAALSRQVAVFAHIGGCVAEALDLSVAYAQERRQFGKAIAEFQAVAHRLADMLVVREAIASSIARLLTDQSDWLLTCLRYWIPAQARKACEDAIQVHGGMGFTWEYGLHLYYRRVLYYQAAFGGGHGAARAVGHAFLAEAQ